MRNRNDPKNYYHVVTTMGGLAKIRIVNLKRNPKAWNAQWAEEKCDMFLHITGPQSGDLREVYLSEAQAHELGAKLLEAVEERVRQRRLEESKRYAAKYPGSVESTVLPEGQ